MHTFRTTRDNGKWFVTKTNERGVVVDYIECETREKARFVMRELKAALRSANVLYDYHREFNNVQ